MILNSYISSRRKRHFSDRLFKIPPGIQLFFNQTRFEESYYRISQSDENFISFIRTITGLNSISVEKYFWLHPTENFYMVSRLSLYTTLKSDWEKKMREKIWILNDLFVSCQNCFSLNMIVYLISFLRQDANRFYLKHDILVLVMRYKWIRIE